MARQRLAGRERARKIIEAAMGLFARRGFRGVTSREIAAAAGVSEALIFKHFPRKDSLYHAILEAKLEGNPPAWRRTTQRCGCSATRRTWPAWPPTS